MKFSNVFPTIQYSIFPIAFPITKPCSPEETTLFSSWGNINCQIPFRHPISLKGGRGTLRNTSKVKAQALRPT